MDRIQELRTYASKDKIGVEIGPWYYPAAPKREGYNCLVLDIFDTETLLARAKAHPLARTGINDIEEVDLVGSSSEIDKLLEKRGLAGKVDYIISSHNFEHIPDPIRFLQACEKVLKPGGVLSMAIPDRRTCFDYFRPHTTLAAWLEAHFEARKNPTLRQIFEHQSLHSLYHINGDTSLIFTLSHDPASVFPIETLQEAFDYWKSHSTVQEATYVDAHCSTFTPATFELLISDLLFLQLVHLQLISIRKTEFHEFFVHLQRSATPTSAAALDSGSFYKRRANLLHRANNEAAANSIETFQMRSQLDNALHRIADQAKEILTLKKEVEDFSNASRRQIEEARAAVAAIQLSNSWRLTAPIRAMVSLLRRVRLRSRNG